MSTEDVWEDLKKYFILPEKPELETIKKFFTEISINTADLEKKVWETRPDLITKIKGEKELKKRKK